jgi:hypothetical protein
MAKKFFVLGIGGTGMRCIESLIHLCGIGMFDDTDLHLLALDTDKNNGNFARLKAVKDAYLKVKSLDAKNRTANKDTFFSANLKYYEFSPNYEEKSSFKDVFGYGDTQYNQREKTDLADLVFSDDVEGFNLRHGYRAQTHLGSMMMYHSIIEEAKKTRKNQLQDFLQALINAAQNGHPRVFILGSVFGGTGASSIPIIPQAISEAANILSNGSVDVLNSAFFGSTLLTAYFNFKVPSEAERNEQKIIATSDKFAMNSQAAMMFYQDDATVKATYQKFYMMGTPGLDWNPMQKNSDAINETITGGDKQKNDSHYIELLAACAALDFYSIDESRLNVNKEEQTTDYQYRSVNDDGKLEFQDFVGQDRAEEFAKKFGMLVISSILCNDTDYDFVAGLQSGDQHIEGFSDVNVVQINGLKDYFALFHFGLDKEDRLTEGWLRQLYRSAGQGDNFVFNSEIFTPEKRKELSKCDWNKKLYKEDGVGKDNHFSASAIKPKFNEFKKAFLKIYEGKSNEAASLTNRHEQLLKQMYDTLVSLYQFK